MAGSSRNLDRKYLTGGSVDFNSLQEEYSEFLEKGIDIIETDLPIHLGPMLYGTFPDLSSKAKYFDKK